jgi:hypothetical protein
MAISMDAYATKSDQLIHFWVTVTCLSHFEFTDPGILNIHDLNVGLCEWSALPLDRNCSANFKNVLDGSGCNFVNSDMN